MSYGKILGAVGASLGLVASYFIGKDAGTKEGKKEGREDGYREAKAENANEMTNLKRKLAYMLKDIAKREDFILCAYGVGISCANANGGVSIAKVETLDDLVIGIGKTQTLSQQTQEKLREMALNPPNLNTVWALIKERSFDTPKHKRLFTQVVDVIASLEEHPDQRNIEFVEVWNALAAA